MVKTTQNVRSERTWTRIVKIDRPALLREHRSGQTAHQASTNDPAVAHIFAVSDIGDLRGVVIRRVHSCLIRLKRTLRPKTGVESQWSRLRVLRTSPVYGTLALSGYGAGYAENDTSAGVTKKD
jgi:hypothetical protein